MNNNGYTKLIGLYVLCVNLIYCTKLSLSVELVIILTCIFLFCIHVPGLQQKHIHTVLLYSKRKTTLFYFHITCRCTYTLCRLACTICISKTKRYPMPYRYHSFYGYSFLKNMLKLRFIRNSSLGLVAIRFSTFAGNSIVRHLAVVYCARICTIRYTCQVDNCGLRW